MIAARTAPAPMSRPLSATRRGIDPSAARSAEAEGVAEAYACAGRAGTSRAPATCVAAAERDGVALADGLADDGGTAIGLALGGALGDGLGLGGGAAGQAWSRRKASPSAGSPLTVAVAPMSVQPASVVTLASCDPDSGAVDTVVAVPEVVVNCAETDTNVRPASGSAKNHVSRPVTGPPSGQPLAAADAVAGASPAARLTPVSARAAAGSASTPAATAIIAAAAYTLSAFLTTYEGTQRGLPAT